MVWLNGSVLHNPPEKQYECRVCQISVITHADGNYEIKPGIERVENPKQDS